MCKLSLPTVTLCAASSVNVPATLAALRACLEQVEFADCLFFTDAEIADSCDRVRVIPIAPLKSARDYSNLLLRGVVDHLRTDHCLIVQWDGFILDARKWSAEFLECDYIGAPWPQFSDGRDVGNGGFSLRSRRLLEACADPDFDFCHPEDVAICRVNRPMLESRYAIRFAGRAMAERFSVERSSPATGSFGFHGVFNMIAELGADRFWEIYSTLDDRSTAFVDYALLMGQLKAGRTPWRRRLRLTRDLIEQRVRRSLPR